MDPVRIKITIPECYLCSLSWRVMREPVRLSGEDTIYYDCQSLMKFINRKGWKSPRSGKAISPDDIVSCPDLEAAIQTEFWQRYKCLERQEVDLTQGPADVLDDANPSSQLGEDGPPGCSVAKQTAILGDGSIHCHKAIEKDPVAKVDRLEEGVRAACLSGLYPSATAPATHPSALCVAPRRPQPDDSHSKAARLKLQAAPQQELSVGACISENPTKKARLELRSSLSGTAELLTAASLQIPTAQNYNDGVGEGLPAARAQGASLPGGASALPSLMETEAVASAARVVSEIGTASVLTMAITRNATAVGGPPVPPPADVSAAVSSHVAIGISESSTRCNLPECVASNTAASARPQQGILEARDSTYMPARAAAVGALVHATASGQKPVVAVAARAEGGESGPAVPEHKRTARQAAAGISAGQDGSEVVEAAAPGAPSADMLNQAVGAVAVTVATGADDDACNSSAAATTTTTSQPRPTGGGTAASKQFGIVPHAFTSPSQVARNTPSCEWEVKQREQQERDGAPPPPRLLSLAARCAQVHMSRNLSGLRAVEYRDQVAKSSYALPQNTFPRGNSSMVLDFHSAPGRVPSAALPQPLDLTRGHGGTAGTRGDNRDMHEQHVSKQGQLQLADGETPQNRLLLNSVPGNHQEQCLESGADVLLVAAPPFLSLPPQQHEAVAERLTSPSASPPPPSAAATAEQPMQQIALVAPATQACGGPALGASGTSTSQPTVPVPQHQAVTARAIGAAVKVEGGDAAVRIPEAARADSCTSDSQDAAGRVHSGPSAALDTSVPGVLLRESCSNGGDDCPGPLLGGRSGPGRSEPVHSSGRRSELQVAGREACREQQLLTSQPPLTVISAAGGPDEGLASCHMDLSASFCPQPQGATGVTASVVVVFAKSLGIDNLDSLQCWLDTRFHAAVGSGDGAAAGVSVILDLGGALLRSRHGAELYLTVHGSGSGGGSSATVTTIRNGSLNGGVCVEGGANVTFESITFIATPAPPLPRQAGTALSASVPAEAKARGNTNPWDAIVVVRGAGSSIRLRNCKVNAAESPRQSKGIPAATEAEARTTLATGQGAAVAAAAVLPASFSGCVIALHGGCAELSANCELTGGPCFCLAAVGGHSYVRAEAVWTRGAGTAGFLAIYGGQLVAVKCTAVETRGNKVLRSAGGGDVMGIGFAAVDGGRLSANQCVAQRCAFSGFLAAGASTVLRTTGYCVSKENGWSGFAAMDNASLATGPSCIAASNTVAGFSAYSSATIFVGEECRAEGNAGQGWCASQGGRLVLEPQCRAVGNGDSGFAALDESMLIAGRGCLAEGNKGPGWKALNGSHLIADVGCQAIHNHGGEFVSGSGASLVMCTLCKALQDGAEGFAALKAAVLNGLGAMGTESHSREKPRRTPPRLPLAAICT